MEVGALLVGEEQVGLPETLEHPRVDREGVGLEVLRQLQPGVVPALAQEDVDPVVLSGFKTRRSHARLMSAPRLNDQQRNEQPTPLRVSISRFKLPKMQPDRPC